MSVSKCCKKPVFVEQCHEGTAYYVCEACYSACDLAIIETGKHGKSHYGTDFQGKTETNAD